MTIQSVAKNFGHTVAHGAQNAWHKVSHFAGHSVKQVGKLPHHMQNNKYVAFGIFASANVAFFATVNAIAVLADRLIERRKDGQEPLSDGKRRVKNLLLASGAAGTVVALNVGLMKATRYALNPWILGALGVGSFATTLLFCRHSSSKSSSSHAMATNQENEPKDSPKNDNEPKVPSQQEETQSAKLKRELAEEAAKKVNEQNEPQPEVNEEKGQEAPAV